MADDAPTRSERERDVAGRPKNARPRDSLGRPLPRGAENAMVEEKLQAHETWETAWHPSPADERDFWQGLTQVAVGFTHYQRGNPKGSVTLLQRGARKIAKYGETYRRVPVAAVAAAARKAAAAIERAGSSTPIEFPTIERTPVR